MGGLSLSFHPLFFAFGLFYALNGKIFIFIIYTLSALLHEIGHSLVAKNRGYTLNHIVLMPFGAVVKGNIDGLKLIDQIKIALAGPLINLAIGLFFVASWWIFPQTYAYTDVVAEANFSLALINFLPIFPLDGGRIILAYLSLVFGKKKAQIICNVIGRAFSVLLFLGFIYTIFYEINLSLLFFSLFVLFSTFGGRKNCSYVRAFTGNMSENLRRGVEVKRWAVDKSVSTLKVISILDENAINEIEIFNADKKIYTLSQSQINKLVENCDLYSPIGKYI